MNGLPDSMYDYRYEHKKAEKRVLLTPGRKVLQIREELVGGTRCGMS